ncbi:MAG: DNA methyltransferase, partial [Polyangiaceae bacterium]
MKQKRSLTHVGGDVELGGDPEAAELLAEALRVPSSESIEEDGEDAARSHIHGFHTYPARMHPITAARLVYAFSSPGKRVLDPFCGSGTVLVEAMLAGRDAVGSDLNPLAVRLARLKTSYTTDADREALLVAAREIAAFADERRKTKAGATRRYPQEDAAIFEPHVMLELDSIRAGVARLKDPRISHPLSLVLSALLVKVSHKQSDTSAAVEKRRTAAGYTAKLFIRKTEELTRLLKEFADALPNPVPRVRVEIDDACELASVKDRTIHAVISSPPYAATYDYM